MKNIEGGLTDILSNPILDKMASELEVANKIDRLAGKANYGDLSSLNAMEKEHPEQKERINAAKAKINHKVRWKAKINSMLAKRKAIGV